MLRYILGLSLLVGVLMLAACQAEPTPTPTTAPPQPTATPTRVPPASTPTPVAPTPTSTPVPTRAPATPTATAAPPDARTGTVEVRVTDAPPEGVTKILMTASQIEAQRSGASGEAGWESIVKSPPVFDLVAVTGLEQVLGSSQLSEGSYTQIRLSIDKVVVTLKGQDKEAELPSDKLRVVGGFQVEAGKTTALTLDFDADKSVVLAGERVQLKPVVKLLVQAPSEKPSPPKKAGITTTGDLVLALSELNKSAQTGVAVLTAKGSQTEVVLQATPGISRANHIHSGTCATLGGVVHALTAMADGSSVTTVNASLDSLLTGGFAINLHKADNAALYTACGDVPAKGKFVTIGLEELKESGQKGVATLVDRGDKTDVAMVATAGISRANHIHSGTCATLGGVVHPLTAMADGISATSVNVKLDSLRTGGFAINLHKADNAAIYTACGDIPAKPAASATTPAPVQATIKNFALPNITIPVGTTVTWSQQDMEGHQVGAGKDGKLDGAGWSSEILQMGTTFSHAFDKPGNFAYTCPLHPSMNGTVTVTEGGTSSVSPGSASGQSGDGYVY